MDALEPEELSDLDEHGETAGQKRKDKAFKKSLARKHRSEVSKANLDDPTREASQPGVQEQQPDQEGDTIYIDNLPNDPQEVKSMLREVRKHIIDLERQFFGEEAQENLFYQANLQSALQMTNAPELKEDEVSTGHVLKPHQYHCVPISVNVVGFDYAKLVAA